MDYRRIGEKIRKVRKEYHITQTELAERVAISSCYLSMIESGKRQANLEILVAIAKEMKVSLEFFFRIGAFLRAVHRRSRNCLPGACSRANTFLGTSV